MTKTKRNGECHHEFVQNKFAKRSNESNMNCATVQWILAVAAVNLFQYLQLTLASLASSGYLLFYSNRREAWTNTNTIAHRQRWLYLLLRGEYTPRCTGQGKVTSGHVVGAVIVLGHYYGPDCVSFAHKIFVIELEVNSK